MWQVIKQERAVSLLQRSLKDKTLSHAYIFVGPEGVGKMMLAKSLAQALFCKEENSPCVECACCKRINELKHPDFQVIELETPIEEKGKQKKEISIEQIRRLKHGVSLPPYEGDYKIFVIDGAESMSISAANCLLKTLEEPSPKTIIILLAQEESKISPTVLSRCQKIELKPMALYELAEVLRKEYKLEEDKAVLLARLGHGRLGKAIEMARNDKVLEQRNSYLEASISLISSDYNSRFEYATKLAADISKRREVTAEIVAIWLDCWRDLLLVKIGLNGEITNIDKKQELEYISEGLSIEEIESTIKIIMEAEKNIASNVNPRLVLEVLMLEMPLGKEVIK
jgi:DNA polymerase-3 subunit delta'